MEHLRVSNKPQQKAEEWALHAPKIGLVGAGAFGNLIARTLAQRYRVTAFDLNECALRTVEELGAQRASLEECSTADIVILAVPVPALEQVAVEIGRYLRPGTLVCDVASVKMAPLAALAAHIPESVQILGTHPLFGPQSAPGHLRGQTIVLCPLRTERLEILRHILSREFGLNVIVMTPEDHDRAMATVQGLTHFIARIIKEMAPVDRAVTTKSFRLLLESADLVRRDSDELYYAIQSQNPFSAAIREQFFEIAESIQRDLIEHSLKDSALDCGYRMSPSGYRQ